LAGRRRRPVGGVRGLVVAVTASGQDDEADERDGSESEAATTCAVACGGAVSDGHRSPPSRPSRDLDPRTLVPVLYALAAHGRRAAENREGFDGV
jgi:hypothetical protein